MDRTNALRQAIEADEPVFGARATTFSPTVVEVYGHLGLDFVWLDFEHAGPSPYDSTNFADLSRAAEVADVELFVRIPSGDPHLIRKVLDAGVRNLLVPRIETAEEVRRAVKATRFRYGGGPGERGIAQGRVTTWGADTDGYVEAEDANVCLGVMIENTTAVENIEEICSVPDLGFVFVGPSDLSVSLGRPLEKSTPEIREQIDRIETTAVESGVPLAGIRNDPDGIEDAVENGYRILRIGGELSSAREVLGAKLDAIR